MCVVVPCFNEAERLDAAAFLAFAEAHTGVAFLFVNDGSTDETAKVLRLLREANPQQVALLQLERNCGKAEAVRLGILEVLDRREDADPAYSVAEAGQPQSRPEARLPQTQYVGYWDADLATPLGTIPAFQDVLRLQPHVELVMGARIQLLGRSIQRSALRHYLGRVFATAASWTLGVPVYDTQCGAKLLRVTARTRELFGRPFSSRWVFDVELLARVLSTPTNADSGPRHPLPVYEYPLPQWHDVAGSKIRLLDGLRALFELTRIA